MSLNDPYYKQLFLKEVLEHLEDGILLCDKDFKIKFINNKATVFLSVENDFSEDIQSIFSHIRSNKARYIKLNSSFRYSTISRPSVELIIHTQPLLDSSRTFSGLLLIMKEIQDSSSFIRQLDLKEKKYRYLLDNTSDGVFLMDDDSNIIEANKSACDIYGISKDDFLALKIGDLFPHQSKAESSKIWEQFLRESTVHGFYKYQRADQPVYIDFTAQSNLLPGVHLAIFKNLTDHIVLQRAYNQTEANFRTLFDNSRQSVFLFDENSRLLSFNEKAEEYYKSISETALTKDLLFHSSQILPISMQVAAEKIARMVEGEIVVDQYSLEDSKTKTIKWLEAYLIPFLDTKRKLKSYCLTIQDITDRKIAEQYLFESEKKFRKLSENSPDIIYIIDIQKRKVTYFNRKTILGYSSKHLEKSEAWLGIVHPDDIERVRAHWKKFIHTKSARSESIEYRLKDKSNQYQWVINRHSVLDRDKDDKVLTVLLNITIITDQKISEESIKNSQQRLEVLIENTNDLIFSLDKNEHITVHNSSFRSFIKNQYNIDIKNGDRMVRMLPDELGNDWNESIQSALKGKRIRREMSFIWHDQTYFFDFSFSPITTEDNRVNGVSVLGRDISRRKKDEENIKRTNFELDSFVYRASHDLRAPLRSVLGLVNLAFEEKNEKERRHYLSLVEKSINRLDTFIEDLTNFSRNSRLELSISKINFKQIIDDCIEDLKFMDHQKPIDVKLDIINRTEFYTDSSRLHIIFQNILSNAIKYRNGREDISYINIRVRCGKNQALISVTDNGIGIREEYIDKIFDMFFRASQDSYGSGLGLYITKQVIEKLGGTIDVESVYGEGSTFHIYLPNHFGDFVENA